MPIVPLFGHAALRDRLEQAARAGGLPASLLLHGPAGVGKQRLALHVAQALLCSDAAAPCGECTACRFVLDVRHPDLHWYFPRPRLKDSDPAVEDVEVDYAEAIAARVEQRGLYPPPPGTEGLYVATVRAMLHRAAVSPALGRRKVFIVGDAERLVSQEGADQAANAFLKLLEEPPADTTIILTSSEPGALLPTIRSRVVAVRVPALPDEAMEAFLAHDAVRERLDAAGAGGRASERLRLAGGAPGRLLESAEAGHGSAAAQRLLDAAGSGSRARWLRAGFSLGVSGARGGFASTLDALSVRLHEGMREATRRERDERALALSGAVLALEAAKEQARGNVNPQLAGSVLLRELATALGGDR